LKKKAVILLSGGLDSTTVLAYAKSQGFECNTLSFDYGQRHQVELEVAKKIANCSQVQSHRVMEMNMNAIGGSALTDDAIQVPTSGVDTSDIPVTYVPARNTIFLSYALALAEVIEANHIFIGVNSVDYSGYPDCRPEYISAFETMANLATKSAINGNTIHIETPLIDLTKSEIIQMGIKLGVDYSYTVSCYQASPEGLACGICDSCRLRKQGFIDANESDPTRYHNS
jgi:7-cyano-7-deazaguanine synthase